MKKLHWLLLAAGISLSDAAQAHDYGHYGHGYGHGGVGFYFGLPAPYYPYYGYPYSYPYYPYPPAVIAPAQPPVYVEQQPQVVQQTQAQPQVAPIQDANNYWYYCTSPEGYYPYVKDCTVSWKKVPATPPK
jgi:hypothetical protein